MSHFLKKIKQKYFTRNGDTLYFGALKRIIFIFFIFVFLLGIGVLTWVKFVQKSGGKVKVPRITGMDILSASELIQKRRLTLKIIPVIKNNAPKYQIVQQNPAPNTTVREGRVIEVVISSGQIYSRMPDFTGKSLYNTKQLFMGQKQIQGMGKLILQNITYVPSNKPMNTIIAQTPKPDSPVKRDVPVYLVVSNGVNHKVFSMPNYQNKYFYKAVKELSFKDIQVEVKSVKSNKDQIARVVSQTPAPGVKIAPGQKAVLSVGTGSGNKIPANAVLIKYIIPGQETGNDANVKIILSDEGNDRILFQGTGKPGEAIIQAVMIRGAARYKIFLNNKLVKNETL